MPGPSSSVVGRSVFRYLVASVLIMVLVGVIAAMVGHRIAVHEELQESRVQARSLADKVVAPQVTEAVRRGDIEAVARLGTLLEDRMRDGSVTHALVYDEDGLVLWSDLVGVRGQSVDLDADVDALFGTQDVITDEPGVREHPWLAAEDDDLIEVYAGARGADGKPFVFEVYLSPEFIEKDRNVLLQGMLLVLIGAMVLLLLATMPLAIGLARRVDRAAAARSTLIDESLAALQRERRRIARVLHDGVIQDLSAVGYALSAIDQVPAGDPELREREGAVASRHLTISRLQALVQDDVQELRWVVGDLLETEPDVSTLRAALGAVQKRGGVRYGLEITLDLDPVVDTLDRSLAEAVFDVVGEGVNNAGVHAGATRVDVVVRRVPPAHLPGSAGPGDADTLGSDLLVVTVTDDGVGPDSAGPAGGDATTGPSTSNDTASQTLGQAPRGGGDRQHFGFRLLAGQLESVDGSFSLTHHPAGGAVLTATIPLGRAED